MGWGTGGAQKRAQRTLLFSALADQSKGVNSQLTQTLGQPPTQQPRACSHALCRVYRGLKSFQLGSHTRVSISGSAGPGKNASDPPARPEDVTLNFTLLHNTCG